MYDIITYSTNDGYSGRFTNKDPSPDVKISYDTQWIDLSVELEAPIDVTTLRGWTLNDELFQGYSLTGGSFVGSKGIVTRKKLYTSSITARIYIDQNTLQSGREIFICITTVVCRDLERLRIGEWIYVDEPDICFSFFLTETPPDSDEVVDSEGEPPIIDDCPKIIACSAIIDSSEINVLKVDPVTIDSDGVTSEDPNSGNSTNQSPDGFSANDPNSGNSSNLDPNCLDLNGPSGSAKLCNSGFDPGFGTGAPGTGGGNGGAPGGIGGGGGGGPGLGLNGPGGSAGLGPSGLGFGPSGEGGVGGASFGPNGVSSPPYTFGPDGIQYPDQGAFIKFNPDAGPPAWEFNPPLPTLGGDGGLPIGLPGQMLSYRPPLDSSQLNPTDPDKFPRFREDLPEGHFMDYGLKEGRFIWGEENLEDEQNNIPPSQFPKMPPEKKEELLNSWPGFSQSPIPGGGLNPDGSGSSDPVIPAGTQPFDPEDAESWSYDPNNDTFGNDTPTDTFSGRTSPQAYNGYELKAKLSSDTPTDYPIAIIVAEIEDPITGKKNNLSVIRRPKTLVVPEDLDPNQIALPYEPPSWGFVYNYEQPDEKWFGVDNSNTNAAPATNPPGFPGVSHDDWVNSGPTTVRAIKENNGIYAETSQFGSDQLDPETGGFVSFDDFPELEKFKNKKTGFGFGSKNQAAKVSDIEFETSDLINHIVDVKNDQIHAYVPDNPDDLVQSGVESSGYYILDSSFGVDDIYGHGRFLFNERTGELFWTDPSEEYKISNLIETTDDLPEGTDDDLYGIDSPKIESRRYFTRQRARSSLSAIDNSGIGEFTYDSNTGIFTYNNIDNTDGLPEGDSNLYYTDERARSSLSVIDNSGIGELIYDSNTGIFTYDNIDNTDGLPEGDSNLYYTDSRVSNYLVENNYYTESDVSNYLIVNNYYDESDVINYLINNNYYTESDVINYVDSNVPEYTLDAIGESGGVKLSLLADGQIASNIHFTGGSNISINYAPDFYKPEQIVIEAVGLDYRLQGTSVPNGVKFNLLKDNSILVDSFQILENGLIDVSWNSLEKIVNLSVDSADIISLINQSTSGIDSGNVISIIETYNILDSSDVISISGPSVSFLEDLLDVSSAPPDSGDYLKWDGSIWVPSRGDSYELLSDSVGYNSARIYLNQLSEAGAYPNSTFSDTTQTVNGNQVTLNGWIAITDQIRLGVDSIGGFISPTDPTPNPIGQGGQVSPGDGTLDPSMNFYTEFATLDGKDCIRLYSSGSVSTFGDVSHGPYLISQDYSYFAQGSKVGFSWRAAAGGDAYDVFAYLLKDDGTVQILLNETQSGTSGDTGWLTVTDTVSQSGNYKFVFVSGTFDYSFGGVAGASLYVTDIKTEVGTISGSTNINGGTGILVTHTSPNTITITNTGGGSGGATNLNDLINVDTTGAITGSILKYDGSSWVVGVDDTSSGGAVTNLDGLSDVDVSTANTGDVLEFDGTNWVPGTITSGGTYTAGDGLNLSSNEFSVDTSVLRTNVSQTITAGKKFNNGIILQLGTDGDMDMYHNAFDNIFDLRNGDLLIREMELGVGTTKFTFERSTGDFTAAGDVTAFSDERLKSNIKTIENGLDKVKSLRGVSYTKDGKSSVGVIAQEVEKILPEVVHQSDEYKAVAYGNMVGVLIEAIKELSHRVEELEANR